jgi:hypothetical protein
MTSKIEKCPCGSGRPKDQCCGKADDSRRTTRMLMTWSLLVVAAASVTALGISIASTAPPAPTSPAATPGATPGAGYGAPLASTGTAPVAGTPAPYEYDPVKNQHWDPAHQHWHSGPPPSGVAGATPTASGPGATPISVTSNSNGQTQSIGTRSPSQRGASIPPPTSPTANLNSKGEVPEPWEYDPVDNTHYDPFHGHWHPGKPPEDRTRTSSQTVGGGGTQGSGSSGSAGGSGG